MKPYLNNKIINFRNIFYNKIIKMKIKIMKEVIIFNNK